MSAEDAMELIKFRSLKSRVNKGISDRIQQKVDEMLHKLEQASKPEVLILNGNSNHKDEVIELKVEQDPLNTANDYYNHYDDNVMVIKEELLVNETLTKSYASPHNKSKTISKSLNAINNNDLINESPPNKSRKITNSSKMNIVKQNNVNDTKSQFPENQLGVDLKNVFLKHKLNSFIIDDILATLSKNGITISHASIYSLEVEPEKIDDISEPCSPIESSIDNTRDHTSMEIECSNYKNIYCDKIFSIGQLARDVFLYKNEILKMVAQNKNFIDVPNLATEDQTINIPLKTVDELNDLEAKCVQTGYRLQLENAVKHFAPKKTIQYCNAGLAKILEEPLLAKFNWIGSQGRLNFSKYNNINKALFYAWKNEELRTFDDYVADIKLQFQIARGRRNRRKRRMMQSLSP